MKRSSNQKLTSNLRLYLYALSFIFPASQTALGNLPLEASNQAEARARPIVGAASNGVPMVHIAPPGSGGVSRNQYEHFNVNANGLILNNSTNRNTQTQLGGSVGPNQQPGFSSARVILNEVLSRHPSQLLGKLEVAGARANVVIANPNGITCNGCGFINTGRATLTTGATRFGPDGNIQGFDVRQGEVRFEGAGLDARQLERLDLIARGIVIEGEVRAQELNMVTGANQVRYDTLEATAQTGDEGTPPQFAVDIKDVGGMHANQIYLVATEKGLGVNSTGRVEALQGNLTLSANGDLKLNGAKSKQQMKLESQGNMELSGQTVSEKKMLLSSKGKLTQKGIVGSKDQIAINAKEFENTGSTILNNAGNLSITTQGETNNRGVIYSGDSINLAASELTAEGGKILSQGNLGIKAGAIHLLNTQLRSSGDLMLDAGSNDIKLHNSQIHSGNDLKVAGRNLRLNGSLVIQRDVQIILSGDYKNEGVFSSNNLRLTAHHADNAGKLEVFKDLLLDLKGDFHNAVDQQVVAENLFIRSLGKITNEGLIDGGATRLFSDTFVNTSKIYGNDIRIQSAYTNNTDRNARIVPRGRNGQLRIGGHTLHNSEGAMILSPGQLIFASGFNEYGQPIGKMEYLINSSSTIQAGKFLDFNVVNLVNRKAHFALSERETGKRQIDDVVYYGPPPALGGVFMVRRQGSVEIYNTFISLDSEPGVIFSNESLRMTDNVHNDKSTISATGSIDYNQTLYQGTGASGATREVEKTYLLSISTEYPPFQTHSYSEKTTYPQKYDLSPAKISGMTQVEPIPVRLERYALSNRILKSKPYVESFSKSTAWTKIADKLNQ